MVRKALALAIVALSMAFIPFAAPQADAAAYGPKLPTNVNIDVVTAVDGQNLTFRLSVGASDGTSPAGTIEYTIMRAGGAGQALTSRAAASSVVTNGRPVLVQGPVGAPGSYLVHAHFLPTNAARYLPSSNANRAAVGSSISSSLGGGGASSSGGSMSGGLPNTGGPSVGWLVAGVVLVGSGAGAVAYSRRRAMQAA